MDINSLTDFLKWMEDNPTISVWLTLNESDMNTINRVVTYWVIYNHNLQKGTLWEGQKEWITTLKK